MSLIEMFAQISISDTTTVIRFLWVGFDGDDCVNDFYIDVTGEAGSEQFSFGPSAVSGLRARHLSRRRSIPASEDVE